MVPVLVKKYLEPEKEPSIKEERNIEVGGSYIKYLKFKIYIVKNVKT